MSMGLWCVLTLVLIVLLPTSAWSADRLTGEPFATRSEVIAANGMAATSQPLATQIALDILKQGGSAVDAAVAANAALALMEPVNCGLGGDLFAIVWDARRQRIMGLNASGRSPQGLTLEELQSLVAAAERDDIPPYGPLPVTVPGCVDGWFALHAEFGKLPIKDVLAPTIRYARDGFPVSELIAHYWERGATLRKDYPGFAATFLPDGAAPQKGDIFRNPGLADTLTLIAEQGRTAFYQGPIADQIDAFCREVGCYLRKEDLTAHRSEWVTPLSTTYRGYEVHELPPNGQGLAALQMLNILEGYDLASWGYASPDYWHVLIEAKKLAFEDRARYYADPDFVSVPWERLASKEYANERRELIDLKTAAAELPAGDVDWQFKAGNLRGGDTIYLTTADADGNLVSLIQSNYWGFGSGLCPPGLGFGLQNRGKLFALDAEHPNRYAPGKRPFHTIIPAFVTKAGQPFLSFGVMGGDMQPQGHVQVLVNIIDFGLNLQEAGDAARMFHGGSSAPTGTDPMTGGGTVSFESGVPAAVREGLKQRGHQLGDATGVFGGYQAIGWDPERKVFIGASESRKDGQAAGY